MLSNNSLTYIIDVSSKNRKKKMFLVSLPTTKHEQPGYTSLAVRSCFINWDAERGT